MNTIQRFISKVLCLAFAASSSILFTGCTKYNSKSNEVISEMKKTLDLYLSESKKGTISKSKFFLLGAVLFGDKAGDYDFRQLHYDFGDNSYFNLTYRNPLDYIEQKDIFNNKLLKVSPGYVGEVIRVPSQTLTLNCKVSFSYQQYTVTNTLKVELYGGSQATAASSGWNQTDENHYTYSYSLTLTDSTDRPTEKYKENGSIDLENLTLMYNAKKDKYNYGLYDYTPYDNHYSYNAYTGLLEIKDKRYSNDIKTYSIYLNRTYPTSKYETDKQNGWDWKNLSYVMPALKLFDNLLVEKNKAQYVSVLYNRSYTYTSLFVD